MACFFFFLNGRYLCKVESKRLGSKEEEAAETYEREGVWCMVNFLRGKDGTGRASTSTVSEGKLTVVYAPR